MTKYLEDNNLESSIVAAENTEKNKVDLANKPQWRKHLLDITKEAGKLVFKLLVKEIVKGLMVTILPLTPFSQKPEIPVKPVSKILPEIEVIAESDLTKCEKLAYFTQTNQRSTIYLVVSNDSLTVLVIKLDR